MQNTLRMNSKICRGSLIILFAFIALQVSQSACIAKQASFQGLGDLSGGAYHSAAYSISANGSVVVGQSESATGTEAFRWENGVITGLGYLPTNVYSSDARGVSADGSVIVGTSGHYTGTNPYNGINTTGAFKWTQSTGMVFLGDGGGSSGAHGVSSDGSVIVGVSDGPVSGIVACRWTTGGRQDLGYSQSYAYGISSNGSTIAGTTNYAPATWDAQGNISYLVNGEGESQTYGISSNGAVVVGAHRTGLYYNATIWNQGNLHVIYSPSGIDASAYDASADGSIVVGGRQ